MPKPLQTIQVIKDPRILPQDFYFVSKDSSTDLVSFLITWRTQGEWNHSMISRTQGKFVWQGLQITEKPMDSYLKRGTRLDFFTLVDIKPKAIQVMNDYINKRMAGNWWSQTYDFLGIFGQAIGVPQIHTPGLDYCSVFELKVLRQLALSGALPAVSCKAILSIDTEVNPQQLHDFYILHPEIFNYVGQYDADNGIVV